MYKIQFKYLFGLNLIKFKGKENKIENKGKIKSTKIKLSGKNNYLFLGENSFLRNCDFYIKGSNNVVYIGKNCSLDNTRIILDGKKQEIKINDRVTAGKLQIVSLEPYKIEIGENCMISYDVEIRNTDSHMIFDKNTNKRINIGKPVEIGNNVWLGMRTLILKGVKIGNDSIVAAGSIVTTDIENNSIVSGIPAKKIKEDVYWNRQEVVTRE
jgi:hypothetical protein